MALATMNLFGVLSPPPPPPSLTTAFVSPKLSMLPKPRPTSSSSYPISRQQPRVPVLYTSETSDTTVKTLEPHYTSESILSWLQKMATSYKLERGEELMDAILREDTNSTEYIDKNNDSPLIQLANICAKTTLPIASHDFLRDPDGVAIYNYGNHAFLHGFGYPWEEFVVLPSKYCVESEEDMQERQQLLDSVKANAIAKSEDDNADELNELASNYDNLIRIRKDRKKILLRGVNLWNVYDVSAEDDVKGISEELIRTKIEEGEMKAIGQAVWIKHVDYLD